MKKGKLSRAMLLLISVSISGWVKAEEVVKKSFVDESGVPVMLEEGVYLSLEKEGKSYECYVDKNRGEIECTVPEAGGDRYRHYYLRSSTGNLQGRMRDYLGSERSRSEPVPGGSLGTSGSIPGVSDLPGYAGRPETPRANIRDDRRLERIKKILGDPNHFMADLDEDGRDEIVRWKRFDQSELGDYCQLLVYDDDGRLLWRGPKEADTDNRYIFGSWDFGVSMPEIMLDTDGDGRPELLAPSPQSDVSPLYYRILGWNGKRFVDRRPAVFMYDPERTDRLTWVNPWPRNERAGWVSKFSDAGPGNTATAEITYPDGRGEYKLARARVKMDPYGAKVLRWIDPLRQNLPSEGTDSYIARIGEQDHYNSRGVRLWGIREILHQDRANYYGGVGDPEDTGTGRFRTKSARSMIDRMRIRPVGTDLRSLRRMIRSGTPLLRVGVEGKSLTVEVLEDTGR